MSRQQRRDSFIVRIWWETNGEKDFWRGWVQHTTAGGTRCFQRMEDLLAFIDLYAGPFSGNQDLFEEGEYGRDGVSEGVEGRELSTGDRD